MEEVRQQARLLLDLVRSETYEEDERLLQCAACLDHLGQLGLLVSFTPLEDDNFAEAPESDPHQLLPVIREHFPSFFSYELPEHLGADGVEGVIQGEMARDLNEICRNMIDVLWYWRAHGENVALCYFQLGFRAVWGRYLRCLQLGLHDLLF